MALATDFARPTFFDRIKGVFEKIRADLARRDHYRQVRHDLAVLSDRELTDIGISRLQIEDIAREAAYAK